MKAAATTACIPTYTLSDLGTGLAAVVLPLEQHPRRSAPRRRGSRAAQDSDVLNQQVRRMLADPRSDALVKNFAGQWLYLRNVPKAPRSGRSFPISRAVSARRSNARPSSSSRASAGRHARVLDLLRAKYTFLNEQLAQYYGIPNVFGPHFRRVELGDDVSPVVCWSGQRLIGHVVSDRTSPVIRGKWIMTTCSACRRRRLRCRRARNLPTGRPSPSALGARAHGSASYQPSVFVVPQAHGSTRLRAREFRRGGAVALPERNGHADRHVGGAVRRREG